MYESEIVYFEKNIIRNKHDVSEMYRSFIWIFRPGCQRANRSNWYIGCMNIHTQFL